MSKNRINALPTYIGDMNDLKVLKLDQNPIAFPPKDVWDSEESDRDSWLEGVKKFLRQHAERSASTQESESGSRFAFPLEHLNLFPPCLPVQPAAMTEATLICSTLPSPGRRVLNRKRL